MSTRVSMAFKEIKRLILFSLAEISRVKPYETYRRCNKVTSGKDNFSGESLKFNFNSNILFVSGYNIST